MAQPNITTEAGKAKRILTSRFGRKERALLSSAKDGIDAATLAANAGVKILKAGRFTTTGGDETETIPVIGCVATDVVLVTVHTKTLLGTTIVTAAAGTDQVTVVFSSDPSSDSVINYVVMRPAT